MARVGQAGATELGFKRSAPGALGDAAALSWPRLVLTSVRSFDAATPDIQHVAACALFVDAALSEATPRRRRRGRTLPAHVTVAATCAVLVPARATDVCDVRATLERGGRRIASTHTRIRPGSPAGRLRFAMPYAAWRARPARLRIHVRTRTRGGVRRGAITIRPVYEP